MVGSRDVLPSNPGEVAAPHHLVSSGRGNMIVSKDGEDEDEPPGAQHCGMTSQIPVLHNIKRPSNLKLDKTTRFNSIK